MRKLVKTGAAIAALTLGTLALSAPAQATETFADPALYYGTASISPEARALIEDCTATESSSRAVRACTKILKAGVTNEDARAQIHTRRALHQMALGRFDKAASDFTRAGEMAGNDDLASLGLGFSAMMDRDLKSARARFEDCGTDKTFAPLAQYGLGLTHQMAGEADQARAAYDRALAMRPGWDAVEEQLGTL